MGKNESRNLERVWNWSGHFSVSLRRQGSRRKRLDLFRNLHFPRKNTSREEFAVDSAAVCNLPSPTFGIGYGTGLIVYNGHYS